MPAVDGQAPCGPQKAGLNNASASPAICIKTLVLYDLRRQIHCIACVIPIQLWACRVRTIPERR